MIVFLSHAGWGGVLIPGSFGVTVFFFLSGYLITTLMRKEAEKAGHVSLKAFYLRRALRILPPFYLVLLGANLLTLFHLLPGFLERGAVTAQALHYTNYWIATRGWQGIAAGTEVFWSLAVEEHFYVVFPTIYILTGRLGFAGRRQAQALWAVCAIVLIWRCVLVFGLHVEHDRTFLCTDTRFDSMLFGCALAVYKNPILDKDAWHEHAQRTLMIVLAPLAVVTLLSTFLIRNDSFRETFRYTLQGIALGPLFVCAIRWPQAWLFRPLNLRPVRFIGNLSYSLYLVHDVTLNALDANTHLPKVALAAVALGVAILVSWTMWIFIEKPCARLRKRLSPAD
jgi:peptidoglycan/LPS O-acetylase OafA/YrhL